MIATMIPYAIAFFLAWGAMTVGWYALDLPLGPVSPVTYGQCPRGYRGVTVPASLAALRRSCPVPPCSSLRRSMAPAPIKLAVGDAAPDFDLPLAGGGRVSLSELRGAPALLWFYPESNTNLCTTQSCDLRDNHQDRKSTRLNSSHVAIS